jgi:hypothetical protein
VKRGAVRANPFAELLTSKSIAMGTLPEPYNALGPRSSIIQKVQWPKFYRIAKVPRYRRVQFLPQSFV